jgi:hypothetical protein
MVSEARMADQTRWLINDQNSIIFIYDVEGYILRQERILHLRFRQDDLDMVLRADLVVGLDRLAIYQDTARFGGVLDTGTGYIGAEAGSKEFVNTERLLAFVHSERMLLDHLLRLVLTGLLYIFIVCHVVIINQNQ